MSQKLKDVHEELIEYALALPGAFEDHPWGERVAKVGKKVFVFFGRSEASDPRLTLAVKLPQSGVAALDQAFTEPTGYGLGKSGWVSATFRPGEKIPVELLRAWVLESYRAIAPKKLVKELDGGAASAPASKPKAKKKAVKQKVVKKKAGTKR
jgi:predicted DNA-binding protein (MmcQ/YjbR family)